MSRRNKPRTHGQGANRVWPIIVFGVILVAAAVFLLTRPGGGSDSGTPQIVVDQQMIDYGYVKFGETRAFEFTVTNAGGGALRFREKPYIEILEGC
ncbi:MAG: hypothetical protein V1755_10260 [Chloroflexota bacterium]